MGKSPWRKSAKMSQRITGYDRREKKWAKGKIHAVFGRGGWRGKGVGGREIQDRV